MEARRRLVGGVFGLVRAGLAAPAPALGLRAMSATAGRKGLFNKLLIANRGEIAIRIIRTAKKMGIPTVALYSDADKAALHARYADEAVYIGAAPSTASYLDIEKVIGAMKATGADAVHPGYGFLSENSHFAAAVADMGATFIGPPVSAVEAMGDKVESKRFAAAAGVNTIPGWVGIVEDSEHAVRLASEIGFPVMIKASAGGGGKGMRIAWNDEDLRSGWDLAVQEAASSFGDSRMLIEKFIESPRHIEIQVLGDKHGNVVYFPERECSIQRRNQKVIEEAPSPFIDEATRVAMGEQAAALCRAVGYHSAGTCEFLVDKHRQFYFLEMNTRLQVEHPVTEAIIRRDLVEEMIRVAAGQPLAFSQRDALVIHGAAIESRVYAEDPSRGYLPSTGRLHRYREPTGPGIRVDSGVAEGSEISMFYDPMISKLITHGADRADALARMRSALDRYVVRGVQHNIPLLRAVLDVPEFVSGDITTAFLAEQYPTPEDTAAQALPLPPRREEDLLALAAALYTRRSRRRCGNSRTPPSAPRGLVMTVGEERHTALVAAADPELVPAADLIDTLEVALAGRTVQVTIPSRADPLAGVLARAKIDGTPILAQILALGQTGMTLQLDGAQRAVRIDGPDAAMLCEHMLPPVVEDTSKLIVSPMPGTLISVSVAVGDVVKPGDEVVVVEAMKMRNVLRASAGGTVASVHAEPGATLAADQLILRFE